MGRGFLSVSIVTFVGAFLATGTVGLMGISEWEDIKNEKVLSQKSIVDEARELFERERQIISEAQYNLTLAKDEIQKLKKENAVLAKRVKAGDLASVRIELSNVSEVAKKWRPAIGFVYCNFETAGIVTDEQMGSGMLVGGEDGELLLTSKHIFYDEEGKPAANCGIKFP